MSSIKFHCSDTDTDFIEAFEADGMVDIEICGNGSESVLLTKEDARALGLFLIGVSTQEE